MLFCLKQFAHFAILPFCQSKLFNHTFKVISQIDIYSNNNRPSIEPKWWFAILPASETPLPPKHKGQEWMEYSCAFTCASPSRLAECMRNIFTCMSGMPLENPPHEVFSPWKIK